jgi:PAS domain S-box-containing protein/putative nucleotidyltransferase with HDIG domain
MSGDPHPHSADRGELVAQILRLCRRLGEAEGSGGTDQARDVVAESEKRYHSLFDGIPVGLYRSTPDGTIVDANAALVEMLGYPDRDALIACNAADLYVAPEDRWRWLADRESNGHIRDIELRLRRRDGRAIWVRDRARTIRDETGRVRWFEGSLLDITEQRQASEALKANERKYRAIVETVQEGLVIADADENIVYANQAFCSIVGCDSTGVAGFNLSTSLSEEDFTTVLTETAKRRRGISSQYEISFRHASGQLRRVRVIASPLPSNSDAYEGSVAAFLDITDRQAAEDALRASEERYRSLTQHLNVGIYRNTLGPRGRFIEANPAIVRMFGHDSREEFLNLDVAELYEHPEERARFNARMLTDGMVRDEELRLKRKDGMPFTASVSAVAVKDEQGTVLYYDGIIEDVTEQRRTEQLQQTFEKLRRTLEGTVHALAATAETTDPYTAGHQYRVARLGCAIAREMGKSDDDIECIRVAGTLHDIGKIYVPPGILSRPGRLAQIEFSMIKAHPSVGYDILKTVEFPWPIAEIVLQHHERIDGSGYPRGLSGEAILLPSRILGVADVVEAMSSHRPYRPALGLDRALEEVSRNRGVLYDADVVDACLAVFTQRGFSLDQ